MTEIFMYADTVLDWIINAFSRSISVVSIISAIGIIFHKYLIIWITERVKAIQQIEVSKANKRMERIEREIKEGKEIIRASVENTRMTRRGRREEYEAEAINAVWDAVVSNSDKVPNLNLLSTINLEEVIKNPEDENLRRMLEVVFPDKVMEGVQEQTDGIYKYRPFIPDHLFSIYSAHALIISSASIIIFSCKSGNDPKKFIDLDAVVKYVEEIMPEKKSVFEKHGWQGVFLVERDVKDKVVQEIRRLFEGQELALDEAQRAADSHEIIDRAFESVSKEKSKTVSATEEGAVRTSLPSA